MNWRKGNKFYVKNKFLLYDVFVSLVTRVCLGWRYLTKTTYWKLQLVTHVRKYNPKSIKQMILSRQNWEN